MSGGNCSACPDALFVFTVMPFLLSFILLPSHLCFSPCLSVSLPLTLHHSLLRSVELMPFRGQMSERERSVSSFSFFTLLSPSLNSLRSDFQTCLLSLSLSFFAQPEIQFQSFMGLSEMYKWWGSLLSVLLCLFSSWECHIHTLSLVPLLPSPLQSLFASLSRFSLSFNPALPLIHFSAPQPLSVLHCPVCAFYWLSKEIIFVVFLCVKRCVHALWWQTIVLKKDWVPLCFVLPFINVWRNVRSVVAGSICKWGQICKWMS